MNFCSGCEKILWVTDGYGTLSEDLPINIPVQPVYVLVPSAKANLKTLKYVANKTGGKLFELTQLDVSNPQNFNFRY